MKVIAAPSFIDSIKKLGSWKSKYYELRGWVRYHIFNKNFRKLLKTMYQSYPWDESYLYKMEKAKIEEMRKYHEKQKRFVGVEYVIRDMKICENLIEIFNGERNLFHYDGDLTFKKTDGGNYEMGTTHDFKYNCDVKVNLKNAERFLPKGLDEKQKQYWFSYPHEIYELKAKHLYHKIRLERDGKWWD